MSSKYSKEDLDALATESYRVPLAGFDVLIKPVPSASERNVMDPRYYEFQKNASVIMGLSTKISQDIALRTVPIIKRIFDMGKTTSVLDGEISVESFNIETPTHPIPVRLYQHSATKDALLIYIHGGGFFGGTLDSVDELCKTMSLTGNIKVLSISYRLAPEHKFPAALHDCVDILDYVISNHQKLQINSQKLYLAGDSAGGNLVLSTLIKDLEFQRKRIAKAILIYPVVDLRPRDLCDYDWQFNHYEANSRQMQVIHDTVAIGKVIGSLLSEIYLSKYIHPANPLVSPIMADLKDLPPLMLVYGQYDFLRIQIEAFIRKAIRSQVKIENIQYLGLGHGFIEQLDTYPQTLDAICEMMRFLNQ